LSLGHPLEAPAGEGRRLSNKSQEATSSPLCRTLKGGAGQRTKCGWEVSKASEDWLHWPQSSISFDFSPGGRGGAPPTRKGH
jgi:hypothetical protein